MYIGERIYPFKNLSGSLERVEEYIKKVILDQVVSESVVVKEELSKLVKANTLLQSYFLGFKDLGGSTLIKRFT